jgi:hypothetical protein
MPPFLPEDLGVLTHLDDPGDLKFSGASWTSAAEKRLPCLCGPILSRK